MAASKATLLSMLNIFPFSFGLIIQQVFDNAASTTQTCLTSQRKLFSHFLEGVCKVASIGLQIGYPTVASVPHSIISGYLCVLDLSVETDYTLTLAEKVKAFLADSPAFVAAAPDVATVLLQLQPQPRQKQRRNQRGQMRKWYLVSLTDHQKATSSSSFICKTRK